MITTYEYEYCSMILKMTGSRELSQSQIRISLSRRFALLPVTSLCRTEKKVRKGVAKTVRFDYIRR